MNVAKGHDHADHATRVMPWTLPRGILLSATMFVLGRLSQSQSKINVPVLDDQPGVSVEHRAVIRPILMY